ncbi:MAG TPA: I78 family peptidase inhibitor [Saliniramus sp.]|nr:I78 family peptidase inhibitor [Saliniramus sp.]
MMARQFTRFFAACALLLFSGAAFAYPAVVTNDLNLRAGPSTGNRVIGTMPQGSMVDVIDCRGSWCEVEWRGRIGYASRNFLAERVEQRAPSQRPFDRRPPVQRPPAAPPSITIPLPGFGIDIRPGPSRPDRPRRDVCNERRAQWALGERARRSVIDDVAEATRARTVRVVRPGEAVTYDYRPDRLTIQVDRRNRIVDLSCG